MVASVVGFSCASCSRVGTRLVFSPVRVEEPLGLHGGFDDVGVGYRRALTDVGEQVPGQQCRRGLVEPQPGLPVVRDVRGRR